MRRADALYVLKLTYLLTLSGEAKIELMRIIQKVVYTTFAYLADFGYILQSAFWALEKTIAEKST